MERRAFLSVDLFAIARRAAVEALAKLEAGILHVNRAFASRIQDAGDDRALQKYSTGNEFALTI